MKSKFLSLITMAIFMTSCGGNTSTNTSIAPEQKTDIDVYLLAGQSNMVGYSDISDLEEIDKTKGFSFLKTYTKGERNDDKSDYEKWVDNKALYPGNMGLDRNHFGPEVGMMHYLEDKYSSFPETHHGAKGCAFIKYSQGGSALYNRWFSEEIARHSDGVSGVQLEVDAAGNILPHRQYNNTNVGDLYYNMITTFIEQINYLSQYHKVHVVGLIWAQGCHDAIRNDMSLKYEENLKYFITDVRRDLGEYFNDCLTLPIIVSEIPIHNIAGCPYNANVAQAEKNVCNSVNNTSLVNTEFSKEGTTDKGKTPPTDPHYTGKDMLRVGKLLGEAAFAYTNK